MFAGVPQFGNYYLAPYLSGTYAYETYKPFDSLYLNSSLLTQSLVVGSEVTGPLNNAIGQSILGNDLFNSLFGASETAEPAGFGGIGLAATPTLGTTGVSTGFGGLGGVFSSLPQTIGGLFTGATSLAGSNPMPQFQALEGTPFFNAPAQSPGVGALATLDPVVRSSLFNEVVSPLFGLILANGGIPPFRTQFFQ